jgi:hypothetical protein
MPCHGGGRPEPIRDPVRERKLHNNVELFLFLQFFRFAGYLSTDHYKEFY